MIGICWFVHRVIASNLFSDSALIHLAGKVRTQQTAYPSIVAIVLRDLSPHVDRPVLQVFVLPELRSVDTRIGMPALVLATWERVHV